MSLTPRSFTHHQASQQKDNSRPPSDRSRLSSDHQLSRYHSQASRSTIRDPTSIPNNPSATSEMPSNSQEMAAVQNLHPSLEFCALNTQFIHPLGPVVPNTQGVRIQTYLDMIKDYTGEDGVRLMSEAVNLSTRLKSQFEYTAHLLYQFQGQRPPIWDTYNAYLSKQHGGQTQIASLVATLKGGSDSFKAKRGKLDSLRRQLVGQGRGQTVESAWCTVEFYDFILSAFFDSTSRGTLEKINAVKGSGVTPLEIVRRCQTLMILRLSGNPGASKGREFYCSNDDISNVQKALGSQTETIQLSESATRYAVEELGLIRDATGVWWINGVAPIEAASAMSNDGSPKVVDVPETPPEGRNDSSSPVESAPLMLRLQRQRPSKQTTQQLSESPRRSARDVEDSSTVARSEKQGPRWKFITRKAKSVASGVHGLPQKEMDHLTIELERYESLDRFFRQNTPDASRLHEYVKQHPERREVFERLCKASKHHPRPSPKGGRTRVSEGDRAFKRPTGHGAVSELETGRRVAGSGDRTTSRSWIKSRESSESLLRHWVDGFLNIPLPTETRANPKIQLRQTLPAEIPTLSPTSLQIALWALAHHDSVDRVQSRRTVPSYPVRESLLMCASEYGPGWPDRVAQAIEEIQNTATTLPDHDSHEAFDPLRTFHLALELTAAVDKSIQGMCSVLNHFQTTFGTERLVSIKTATQSTTIRASDLAAFLLDEHHSGELTAKGVYASMICLAEVHRQAYSTRQSTDQVAHIIDPVTWTTFVHFEKKIETGEEEIVRQLPYIDWRVTRGLVLLPVNLGGRRWALLVHDQESNVYSFIDLARDLQDKEDTVQYFEKFLSLSGKAAARYVDLGIHSEVATSEANCGIIILLKAKSMIQTTTVTAARASVFWRRQFMTLLWTAVTHTQQPVSPAELTTSALSSNS